MSKKWYTGDFHLFHYNIIKYCKRPFSNVGEMNNAIVDGMNSMISSHDDLFILGDVSFRSDIAVINILKRIHGKKHLIVGNHDGKKLINNFPWESVNNYLEISDMGTQVILCHYPIESWKNMHRGYIHLHGHRHGVFPSHLPNECPWGLRSDVGVDAFNFKPVDLDILTTKWLKEGRLV